jgi:hypothetical protein
MNGRSRIGLLLSAVALIGVLMALGQTSAFAQSALPRPAVEQITVLLTPSSGDHRTA